MYSRMESKDFTKPANSSDLILVVEGTQLHVHKETLSEISPVWKRMFLSGFREENAKEITLPDKILPEFEDFLQCIYISDWPITDENVKHILHLSDEYQMDSIKKRCEQFLLTQNITLESLVTAQEYGMKLLYNEAMAATKSQTMEELERHSAFKNLNTSTVTNLFRIKMNILRDYANEMSQQAKQMEKDVEKLKQEKEKYTSALQTVQNMWEKPNMRCVRHMGQSGFDYSCPHCNERIQRETKRICRDAQKTYYIKYYF